MYVRLVTLPTNVVLNAVLIFGLGPAPALGVAGAAIGTAVANTLATGIFLVLLTSGQFAIQLPLGGRQFDVGIVREIVRVGLPLTGMRLLQTVGRFPFLFLLGLISTPALAAYAIGRRVMLLAMMPAWGYSTAASTLVGQHVGGEDTSNAAQYGWQTARIALATQLAFGIVLAAFARPIAHLFGTAHVDLTVTFIYVFGLIVVGFSLSRTMRGSLRGAGDTRWPMYGTALGSYVIRLPIAVLALPVEVSFTIPMIGLAVTPGLGWGLPAIYAALVLDYYAKAAVNTGRFWTGAWRAVAKSSDLVSVSD